MRSTTGSTPTPRSAPSTKITSPRSFELAGVDDPAAQAQRVLDLETLIAGAHWDKVRCRDHPADVQPGGLDEFIASYPDLHWREFLAGARIDESR